MSLMDTLANAGKAASAMQSAGKLIAAAAPLIEKAKELKASHPEIFERITKDVEKFKTMHPVVSTAATALEKQLLEKIPALTSSCESVAAGGSTTSLLSQLGSVEGLISKLGALK